VQLEKAFVTKYFITSHCQGMRQDAEHREMQDLSQLHTLPVCLMRVLVFFIAKTLKVTKIVLHVQHICQRLYIPSLKWLMQLDTNTIATGW